jgi:AraC family transcriptional regulator
VSSAAEGYRKRFQNLLVYIDAHLDEALGLEQLSSLAGFSKFHFQRQFSELFGISVYKYVQLSRLKRAAYQLAFRSDARIIEIALESGYDGPEAFARAFKKNLGQSPSEFRKQPEWRNWQQTYQPLLAMRNEHMTQETELATIEIIDFKATRVAALEHHGDPALLGDSIRKFIEWRKQNRLPPSLSATFNIAYGDSPEIEPSEFRFDLCAATEREIAPNAYGVIEKVIPGGRCARLRHIGSDDNLGKSIRYLYAEWLPQSGEEPRDFPLFFQRVSFFPDVAEHAAITDIFLPLA